MKSWAGNIFFQDYIFTEKYFDPCNWRTSFISHPIKFFMNIGHTAFKVILLRKYLFTYNKIKKDAKKFSQLILG